MLRVGLTGGIGSGKSTVARRLSERGAAVIDADQVAREVVAPGSRGLHQLVEEFGERILDPAGALDRAAMARRVFDDDEARRRLNGIVHPLIGERTAELMDAAPRDAIVVHDVPLLVENGLAPGYQLVIVVDAPEEDRLRRLEERGVDTEDARSRIEAQASTEQRREVADVWLDNAGSVDGLKAAVDRLWTERLVPFEVNVRRGQKAERPGPPRISEPDPEWPRQARRLIARIKSVAGDRALRVDHVGSTSVPGLAAKDVIDIQLTVSSMAEADALAEPLTSVGFPARPAVHRDEPKQIAPDPDDWRKRFHSSADPGRRVNLHLRSPDTAGWRFALLFPAWLRAEPEVRAEYEAFKRDVARQHADDADTVGYSEDKEPWFDRTLPRAEAWAERVGWEPPEC